jgi:ketosteroid isomerase-like protein
MNMATPSGEQVVRDLWGAIQARDWDALGALLADDVRVEWPAARERFVGREAFVAVQSRYPEGWTIRPVRVVSAGDVVVSEVEVPHPGLGLFAVASFWWVRDGVVVAAREYWVTVGGEDPPAWRRSLAQRYEGPTTAVPLT